MFILPSIEQCRANKRSLINKWLKNKESFAVDFIKAKNFFEQCFIFHHFAIPYNYIGEMEGQIPKSLTDGKIKSHAELEKKDLSEIQKRTLDFLDIPIGLNQYVFFSFGAPLVNTGPGALIFALSLKTFLQNYEYSEAWVSWGDIFTHMDQLYGIISQLSSSQERKLLNKYKQTIFLLEDIPELAAYFVTSHENDIFEVLNKRWKKFKSGYWGPEIKIKKFFPLKLVSHCFIDHPNSRAGKLAYALYDANILTSKPIEDCYFAASRFREFNRNAPYGLGAAT